MLFPGSSLKAQSCEPSENFVTSRRAVKHDHPKDFRQKE